MSPWPRPRASPRPAAILGGNRIPFARSNGPYAQASNQDMFTSAPRRAHRPLRSRWRDRRRGRRRRRPQARARLQPDPRVRHWAARSATRRPPTTSSRRATPASRPRSSPPTRSRSARSTWRSPAASTPPATRRSASTMTCGGCWSRSTRPRARPTRSSCWRTSGRRTWRPTSLATPSRGPGCRWASMRRSRRASGASRARLRTS